jgi:O-antigen/teichoic acid export membrane protein
MSQNLELRRLARDSSYNLIRQIWIIIIGLIVSIILARGLGAEQRGIYTLAVLLPEILVIFESGSCTCKFFISKMMFPDIR